MHYNLCVAIGALGFLKNALGAPKNSNLAPNQQFLIDYTFDTQTTLPGVANNQQIGEYNLLSFTNIVAAPLNLNTALRPHTSPNVGAFTARSQLSTPGQPAQVTIDYTESPISSFQALSFYYGCVVASEEAVLGIKTPCTISATGYTPSGKQVAQQDFKFTPAGVARQDLVFATFSKQFNGLGKIVFQVTNNLTTVGAFDDLVANVFQNTQNVIQ